MPPVALLDLKASYHNGQVHMSWQFPPQAPDTVHIFALKSKGPDTELDPHSHIAKELRDCIGGLNFAHSSIYGSDVKKTVFCAYLADRSENFPSIRSLQALDACFVSVITGEARVIYDLKTKNSAFGLLCHHITIHSSSEFDPGILGYSYNFNGRIISVDFPGKISPGLKEYPALYLPPFTEPVIETVGGNNSDIIVLRQKIPFLKRLLKH